MTQNKLPKDYPRGFPVVYIGLPLKNPCENCKCSLAYERNDEEYSRVAYRLMTRGKKRPNYKFFVHCSNCHELLFHGENRFL